LLARSRHDLWRKCSRCLGREPSRFDKAHDAGDCPKEKSLPAGRPAYVRQAGSPDFSAAGVMPKAYPPTAEIHLRRKPGGSTIDYLGNFTFCCRLSGHAATAANHLDVLGSLREHPFLSLYEKFLDLFVRFHKDRLRYLVKGDSERLRMNTFFLVPVCIAGNILKNSQA